MTRFLVSAVVSVEADSESEALDAALDLAQTASKIGMGDLIVQSAPRIELDEDSIEPPRLRTEPEMDLHPPIGDNLVTGDIEWLRTHEQTGIRVDLYDVHRDGKRSLPLFGYRLSWRHEDGLWEILFTGEDYEPGPSHDDDMILADLLGFLAAYDELTDSKATPRQKKWLAHYRDELSIWSAELEGELDDGRD